MLKETQAQVINIHTRKFFEELGTPDQLLAEIKNAAALGHDRLTMVLSVSLDQYHGYKVILPQPYVIRWEHVKERFFNEYINPIKELGFTVRFNTGKMQCDPNYETSHRPTSVTISWPI